MGMLISGTQLRLSGHDAEDFLRDTGRSVLPKTVHEYNLAHQASADAWRATECPEGDLLALLNESAMIQMDPDTQKVSQCNFYDGLDVERNELESRLANALFLGTATSELLVELATYNSTME